MAESSQPACTADPSQQKPAWQLIDKSSSNCVYVKPGVEWVKYVQFEIEPVSYEPAESQKQLSDKDVRKLTTFFERRLRSSYKDRPVGNGATLKIKPVITGIKRSKSILNALAFPLSPFPVSYGGASVHYDLIDGASGEVVGVVTIRRRGRPWNSLQGVRSLGHAQVVLTANAKRIKRDTDGLTKSTLPSQASTSSGM
jgi:hypothetical protein